MAETRIDDLPESDVFEISILGLGQQLQRFFPDRTIDVVTIAGMTALRSMARKNAGKIKFPFFAMRPSSLAKNGEGYNPTILARRGRIGPRLSGDTGNITDAVFHLVPTKVTMNVNMLTNDFKDVIRFSQRWMFASIKNYLNYQLDVEGEAPINIHVQLMEEFTFPDMENEDVGELFNVEATLTLNTYLGYVRKRVAIQSALITTSSVNETENGSTVQPTSTNQANFAGT